MSRDDVLPGATYKVELDEGKPVFVTINEQDGKPIEVFIRRDEPETFEWVNTVTVLITRLLIAGEPLQAIARELQEIHSPRTSHFAKGVQVPSLPARIGMVLEEHVGQGMSVAV